MHKLINACLVIAVLVSAFFLYSLEHSTRDLERQIADLRHDQRDESETMKLLEAEWSSLTRPDRLQKLATEHLKLKTVAATQLVSVDELKSKVPEVAPAAMPQQASDPIGDILQKMQ